MHPLASRTLGPRLQIRREDQQSRQRLPVSSDTTICCGVDVSDTTVSIKTIEITLDASNL